MKQDEIIGGIVLFLFGAVTTLFSLKMSIGTFRMAGTGLFPLCLGILLMMLSATFILRPILKAKKVTVKQETAANIPTESKQMGFFLGTMVFATLFFNLLGYPLISFLSMVALLRILGMKRWVTNILFSLVAAGVSYFLFVQWLKIPLPKGWIGL